MLAVSSTLQLLLAIVPVLFGVCGNLAIPFVSYCTTLRCPHITALAVLDFTVTLLGPGLMLLTIVIGPTWLEHNKTLCQSLSFLSSWALITCFLVLFFFAVCCQKAQHGVSFPEKRRSKRRGCGVNAMRLLTGLLVVVDILLGWSVFNDLHLLPSCNLLIHVQIVSKSSVFYLASSFIFISITIFLATRAMRKQCRLYSVQMFWERHKYEMKINDPEMTTLASVSSSNQSHATSRSNRPNVSRRSSGWRSGMLSVTASPLVSRKASQQSLAAVSLRQALLNVALLSFPGRGAGEDVGRKTSDLTYPVAAMQKNAERKPRSASSPQEPFVISSGIPFDFPILPVGRRVFRNPRILPHFKDLQRQRSLSRFLLLKSCVTGLCWLPLYAAVALQLSSVENPQELRFFIHWLIFLPSSISPLLSLCDANFGRRFLRRATYYVLKTCACGLHKVQFQTAKSDDEIEGARQVRLMDVRPLQTNTL